MRDTHIIWVKMKKKKILVTGGSGFLGSALVKKLSSEGNDVYVFDNEFRGSKNRIKGINISNVKYN